jgi:hypothetical protein
MASKPLGRAEAKKAGVLDSVHDVAPLDATARPWRLRDVWHRGLLRIELTEVYERAPISNARPQAGSSRSRP